MNDFLTKPIEPEDLWQVLRKWIPVQHPGQPVATLGSRREAPGAGTISIAGIDAGPALRRMLGNSELFFSTLRKFCQLHEDSAAALRAALTEDDWPTAQRLAHTLKGVAGSIGAGELEQDAAALERALTERQPRLAVDARIGALAGKLSSLIAAVRAGLPAMPATSSRLSGTAAAEELEALLAESNPEAMAWLEEHAPALSGLLPAARLTEIQVAVRSCDLDDALRLLRQARASEGQP